MRKTGIAALVVWFRRRVGAGAPARARIKLGAEGELLLVSYGLGPRHIEFVHEYLAGTSMKEIALKRGLSHSTIRNEFSAIYKKLGIAGAPELLVLGATHRVR